jgi:hypothetical protein
VPKTVLPAGASRVSRLLAVLADSIVDRDVEIGSLTSFSESQEPWVTASLVIGRPTDNFWMLAQAVPISQHDIVWVTEVETAVETLPSCRRKQPDFSFYGYGVHN